MSGAIPPFPNTPSWCGAQLKKAQGLYLHLTGALQSHLFYVRYMYAIFCGFSSGKKMVPH
jgi:hypothetical protein